MCRSRNAVNNAPSTSGRIWLDLACIMNEENKKKWICKKKINFQFSSHIPSRYCGSNLPNVEKKSASITKPSRQDQAPTD